FLGVLDAATGRLTYANAGHCPALLTSAGRAPVRLRNTGAPLGVLENLTWEQHDRQLHPGDTLLLYTDGISEAQSAAGQFFCIEGLEAVMQASPGESAAGLLERVLRTVNAFAEGKHLEGDDIAVLALRREERET
ncbi:MAG: PP2C family protein-serine/threonine phosphatase, partial [Anaerolineae bacterium]|nr:PP2C family protein-serine/threonine phosphatase [Anaerolineae bacterium]